MRYRGYSLLELMVIVAIIGLFVGFAVPSYKDYILKTRINSALNVMKYYAQLGQEYYEEQGKFGNAEALGLETGAQPYLVANPQNINEYTSIQVVNVDNTEKCYNNIRFTFDSAVTGAPQTFDIQMVVRNVDGFFVISCGIPWDQNASTYANVLTYFPEACQDQNVSTCAG